MRVYTVIPKALGHISTWLDKLPHLSSKFTDVVLLQPITLQGPSLSPYAASDYFSIDTSVADSIDQVIDFGLKNDVGIGIDLVFNHAHPKGKMMSDRPDWVLRKKNGLVKHTGYNVGGKWFEWSDLVL